jgi:glycosyltransferase involved in cell wall biosynthesis
MTSGIPPERDASALAMAVSRLLDDRTGAASMTAAAARDVRERFSPEHIARVFEEVYRRSTRGHGW